MILRPYQTDAVSNVRDAWKDHRSVLIVLPTGTGKTIVFSHIAGSVRGRVMVIAHREELISQAAQKIKAITGDEADVEMGDFWASEGVFNRSRVVVSSVQTQNAGGGGDGRMSRFAPEQFDLLIIDEAHHATAPTYRRLIDHYRQNPDLKVLGVTATPDRADEEALGQVFDSVAFDYEIADAIADGWLVPVRQRAVYVEGLDYSSVRTTAGDLNGADLARILEYEEALHGIAHPTMELVGTRKALVFAASVAHAERLAEIFNRHRPGCARFVCGTTPKDERRNMFADYAAGKFQILVNVGVATEGFDDPSIEVVVMARPTKSRSLYAQMAGRGTRTLPGIVDGLASSEDRKVAITASPKPFVEVIDFVGNSGRHKLMTTADILGGNYSDAVVERARQMINENADGQAQDIEEILAEAEEELRREKEQEMARRAGLRVRAKYSTGSVDPFDVLQLDPVTARGWDRAKQPTRKQRDLLERKGVDTTNLTFTNCSQIIGEIIDRQKAGQCTFKQAKILAKYGYPSSMTFEEASKTINAIAKNGWRRPAEAVV